MQCAVRHPLRRLPCAPPLTGKVALGRCHGVGECASRATLESDATIPARPVERPHPRFLVNDGDGQPKECDNATCVHLGELRLAPLNSPAPNTPPPLTGPPLIGPPLLGPTY